MVYIFPEVMRIASELTKFGEVIAGSPKEKQIIEMVKMFIEDYVDNIRLEPLEVLSWSEEFCIVYIDGVPHRCSIHPPYHGYIDVEINPNETVFVKRFNDVDKLSKDLKDKVVVIEDIDDPNYVAVYTYILRMRNPLAIIFIDKSDALRKIVAIDDLLSRYTQVSSSTIPAVHVSRELGHVIKAGVRGVHIVAKSSLRPSYGFNVLLDINGRDVGSVYLAAHHDKWFNSLVDDSLGVAILLSLVKSKIIGKLLRVNTVLAIFTAEEGFPNPLTSFYWLVGSRYHVAKNFDKILNDVGLVINLDVVYRGRTVFSTSNLFARGILVKSGVDIWDIEHDSMLFDSFSFTLAGVPSITIHNYYDVLKDGIYHSTLDNIDLLKKVDVDHVDTIMRRILSIVTAYYDMVKSLKLVEAIRQGVKTLAYELAEKQYPLEIAYNLYKALQNIENCGRVSKVHNLLPTLNRVLVSTYVSESIYRGEEVYERTSYLTCLDNVIHLPLGLEKSRDECYKDLMYNLESLAYILRC